MAARKKTVQATTSFAGEVPKDLTNHPFYGFQLDEEQQKLRDAIWNPDIDIVFCNSKAGTGKTFVSTGVANLLVQYGLYDRIIYIMSPYGERKQGWLPGTLATKSSVYFEAFYQALVECGVNPSAVVNDESMVNQKNGTGYITCVTDTYLRGSNLNNCVVLIDEAQNYTKDQLKKVLTRIGSNAKVVVIGHDLQCDLERPELSGFVKYMNHFQAQERCAVCELKTNHRGWISRHADELF